MKNIVSSKPPLTDSLFITEYNFIDNKIQEAIGRLHFFSVGALFGVQDPEHDEIPEAKQNRGWLAEQISDYAVHYASLHLVAIRYILLLDAVLTNRFENVAEA